jgi:cell division protease FtsH
MMQPKQPTPRKQSLEWLWWIVILLLLAWTIWQYWPKSQPLADLSYTTFLSQVQAGNVTRVQIAGADITGAFARPYTVTNAVSKTTQTYAAFQTRFPDVVGDASLLPLLESHQVVIDVAPASSNVLLDLLINGLPVLLLVGVILWSVRQSTGQQSGVFSFGRDRARVYLFDRPQVTFDDVADVEEAKNDLREVVDFLRQPDKYHKIGARIPRGVLLVGPPGTGKTLMARAVAGEAAVPFFSISASEFVEMFVGVGASRVRDLFQKAKELAPAIVFIDELDAVGRRRGAGLGNVNDEREQTLNQLLVEMDGFDERHEVIVLAATNRPDVLDPALLRPGRFDRQVTIGLPDRKGREDILKIHTRGLPLGADVDLGLLSRTTTGLSGADLANLTNEAALAAARQNHREVSLADFEEALDKLLLGGARPLLLDAHDRRVVAYHEAGHALVAWLTPGSDPVHKITIIPHGRALGVTAQMPEDDHYNYSRGYLLARLAVMLGGRAAEQIALDDITTGAENDLVEATRLARRMVTRWGMGALGPLAFQADDSQPFLGYELAQGKDYSETTAARIDESVEQLINERYAAVRHLLLDMRGQLDRLVQALLHEETLDQDRLAQILGPRLLAEQAQISQKA